MNITSGMDSRKAVKIAKQLGASVNKCRGGELKLYHPALNWILRISIPQRRRDSPRSLTAWLKQLKTAVSTAKAA